MLSSPIKFMITGIFIVLGFIKSTMRKIATKISVQKTASITAIVFMLFTVIFSESVKSAAADAVSNCLTVIIPCIFPVTALSFFILETGIPVKLMYLTDRLLNRFFGLSGSCLEGVILGLTGGYNTAVKCAVKLKSEGRISKEQAKRIALFFTNPGISFTVLLAGASLSGTIVNGLRLYGEIVFLNLITAYIYNKFNYCRNCSPITVNTKNVSDAFISAVESASSAIISISFNIIIFSCIVCVIGHLLPITTLKTLLKLISEVSSAVIYSSSNFPFYITAGVLTFGGLCIFIQNLRDIKKLDITPSSYIFVRIIHGILVTVTEFLLSRLFPESIYTSAFYPVKFSASGSITGTISLVFLCAVYVISVRNIKSSKFTTKKVR